MTTSAQEAPADKNEEVSLTLDCCFDDFGYLLVCMARAECVLCRCGADARRSRRVVLHWRTSLVAHGHAPTGDRKTGDAGVDHWRGAGAGADLHRCVASIHQAAVVARRCFLAGRRLAGRVVAQPQQRPKPERLGAGAGHRCSGGGARAGGAIRAHFME